MSKFFYLKILEFAVLTSTLCQNMTLKTQSKFTILTFRNSLESYFNFANTLPSTNDDPEIFGMHENANITYQAQESTKIIDTIVSIQPRTGGG